MGLRELSTQYLPAIEDQLQLVVNRLIDDGLPDMYHILAYHMGWIDSKEAERVIVSLSVQETSGAPEHGARAGNKESGKGKRIRPLIVLLVTTASGGNWHEALPAAAAVELLHNFSLIHDDIEDNSPLRRGRQTVWSRWGIPLAINAGDAMFTLSFLSLLDLGNTATVHQAMGVLLNTSLSLTEGQHLDISYEDRKDLRLEDYWSMVSGKTAALLAACCELGALAAHASLETRQAYTRFGRYLGLAFQVQDDWLGIWGDSLLTGKSAESDLVAGKKSLPVLYGINGHGTFAERWERGAISIDEVPEIAALLAFEGARQYTEEQVQKLTSEALGALNEAGPLGDAGSALYELADHLLKRKA